MDDVVPFWDNMEWIKEKFGIPSLIQKPESMELTPPDNNGNYVYLMIFLDGNRIDLTITSEKYADYDNMWKAAFNTLYLFGDAVRMVAAKLEFTYNELEEKGIEDYMRLVKSDSLKYDK